MDSNLLKMKIRKKTRSGFLIDVSRSDECVALSFCPKTKRLLFHNHNDLCDFLLKNEAQFRKLLHNKRPDTFYAGFVLNFVLTDDKDTGAYSDKKSILVLDKRNGLDVSHAIETGLESITKLYTDGSFLERSDRSGFACIIEFPDGECIVDYGSTDAASSTLTELHAAMRGLEILSDCDEIRIVTDSQYVRKGLTEWIRNWKLNDWYTANGTKVKNIDAWKHFDSLAEGKYIEFEWVKSHRNHLQNILCDKLARSGALL